jgi:hypothetical protein
MRWFRNPDWWMVALTALLFVVGFVTLMVFYSQFKEMQTQTGILNTQAQQAAKDSIEASSKVERQLGFAQRQANAADENVKVLKQQMIASERAWLSPVFTTEDKALIRTAGGTTTVNFHVFNSGKTQANNVTGHVVAVMILKTEARLPFDAARTYPDNFGIIYPSSSQSGGAPLVERRADGKWEGVYYQDAVVPLEQFPNAIFGFGTFSYSDIFDKTVHVVEFCQLLKANFLQKVGSGIPPLLNECYNHNRTYDKPK